MLLLAAIKVLNAVCINLIVLLSANTMKLLDSLETWLLNEPVK